MYAIVIGILLGLFALIMMIPNPILGSIILAIIIYCNLDIVVPIVLTFVGGIVAVGLVILWVEIKKEIDKPVIKVKHVKKYDPSEDGWC